MQKSALSFSCFGFWNLGWVPCSCTTFSTKLLSVALGNQHSSSSRAKMPGGPACVKKRKQVEISTAIKIHGFEQEKRTKWNLSIALSKAAFQTGHKRSLKLSHFLLLLYTIFHKKNSTFKWVFASLFKLNLLSFIYNLPAFHHGTQGCLHAVPRQFHT